MFNIHLDIRFVDIYFRPFLDIGGLFRHIQIDIRTWSFDFLQYERHTVHIWPFPDHLCTLVPILEELDRPMWQGCCLSALGPGSHLYVDVVEAHIYL